MIERTDAIIVGAGHNGLVCGTYLARAGQKVLFLEARSVEAQSATSIVSIRCPPHAPFVRVWVNIPIAHSHRPCALAHRPCALAHRPC